MLADPAFVAIMVYFMSVASLGYTVAFHNSLLGFLKGMLYSVVVDFALVGLLASTLGWYLANNYLLIEHASAHTTEQTVEWLYAFDIHCNSFFPFFILLYVLQFFLLPLLMGGGLLPCILSNVLYAIAFTLYFYITFLGYDILPFLQHTTVFLYPIAAVAVGFLVMCLLRANLCTIVMRSYFG
jgi:UNC-50 family